MTDHMTPAAPQRPETAAEGPTGASVPGGDGRGSGDNAMLSPEPPTTRGRASVPRRPFDPTRDASELVPMVSRVLRSLVRRAESGDIEALESLLAIREASDIAMADAAYGLTRAPGHYTWGEVGRWLGMTRQGARQRWGREDRSDD